MVRDDVALSIPDAAAYLGVALSTMYRFVDRQLVPVFRSVKGNRLRVRLSDLELLRDRMLDESHRTDR